MLYFMETEIEPKGSEPTARVQTFKNSLFIFFSATEILSPQRYLQSGDQDWLEETVREAEGCKDMKVKFTFLKRSN